MPSGADAGLLAACTVAARGNAEVCVTDATAYLPCSQQSLSCDCSAGWRVWTPKERLSTALKCSAMCRLYERNRSGATARLLYVLRRPRRRTPPGPAAMAVWQPHSPCDRTRLSRIDALRAVTSREGCPLGPGACGSATVRPYSAEASGPRKAGQDHTYAEREAFTRVPAALTLHKVPLGARGRVNSPPGVDTTTAGAPRRPRRTRRDRRRLTSSARLRHCGRRLLVACRGAYCAAMSIKLHLLLNKVIYEASEPVYTTVKVRACAECARAAACVHAHDAETRVTETQCMRPQLEDASTHLYPRTEDNVGQSQTTTLACSYMHMRARGMYACMRA
eukprot:264770-Chlamydomonas_euryale.AAC.5